MAASNRSPSAVATRERRRQVADQLFDLLVQGNRVDDRPVPDHRLLAGVQHAGGQGMEDILLALDDDRMAGIDQPVEHVAYVVGREPSVV